MRKRARGTHGRATRHIHAAPFTTQQMLGDEMTPNKSHRGRCAGGAHGASEPHAIAIARPSNHSRLYKLSRLIPALGHEGRATPRSPAIAVMAKQSLLQLNQFGGVRLTYAYLIFFFLHSYPSTNVDKGSQRAGKSSGQRALLLAHRRIPQAGQFPVHGRQEEPAHSVRLLRHIP